MSARSFNFCSDGSGKVFAANGRFSFRVKKRHLVTHTIGASTLARGEGTKDATRAHIKPVKIAWRLGKQAF